MDYICRELHCVKSVRIRSSSGPYFPAFGLNAERYSVSLRTQSEYGKTRTLFRQCNIIVFCVDYILRSQSIKNMKRLKAYFIMSLSLQNKYLYTMPYFTYHVWRKEIMKKSLITLLLTFCHLILFVRYVF